MFVGREAELGKLNKLFQSKGFQMVVVYGRRRVGKTSLISEFAKGKKTLFFTALDQADKDNLADFSNAIWTFFNMPKAGSFDSWSSAFDYIADRAGSEKMAFVFDELPYAAKRNESIPSALQICIDRKMRSTNLFVILCGSNQGFMESEVLGRKSPLYGRRTAQMQVKPLGYLDAAKMFPQMDAQDQFRYYGCFGGVPYYLEQIDPTQSFWENVAQLYFDTSGFLYDEPYGLLRQEFAEPAMYNSILRAIASGANRTVDIANRTGAERTSLPRYLKSLISLGIVERAVPFAENLETSKKAIYRISEACYDFWFTFVMPRAADVEQGLGKAAAASIGEKALSDYLGRRFERLCLEWLVVRANNGQLPIAASRVGSWWGANPRTREQDDIDVIAADPVNKLLVIGECKYRESFDESDAIERLDGRRNLVKGYTTQAEYLFSKHPLAKGTREKIAVRADLASVTLEDMYA